MPLRSLFRYLANNDKLVQQLAESYPVRRAAQLAISIFYKGKAEIDKIDPQSVNKLSSFVKRFQENLKQEIEAAKRQQKK